jgi:hypothetical protein
MTKNEAVNAALSCVRNNPREAYKFLAAEVGVAPLKYTYNFSGSRFPRKLGSVVDPDLKASDPTGAKKAHRERTQHEMCLRHCYAVANERRKHPRPTPDNSTPEPEPETSPEPTPSPTPPEPVPSNDFERDCAEWLKWCAKAREFVAARNNFDPLASYRLEEDGIRLLAEGLPIDGLKMSVCASWSADSRAQLGVKDFDYQAWGRANGAPDDLPGEAEYLYRVLKAGVFAYCHGPSQIGKSYGLKYAAKRLELEYYETCIPGCMPSALKGKYVGPSEYVDSNAKKAYRDGGLFNIDEIDFGEPDVLGSINNSVTNGVWHCDVTGDIINKSGKFRLAATANTLGQGTDKRFQRNVIDGATQERFRLGRIEFKHDPTIAARIARAQIEAARERMAA